MDFQTKASCTAGVLIADGHEPFAPTFGQYRRFFTDTMCLITKGLMKGGSLANGAINQVVVGGPAQ